MEQRIIPMAQVHQLIPPSATPPREAEERATGSPSPVDPNASLTLEQAEKRIRDLLKEGESSAWELGDLLNTIEKRGMAQAKGYGKTKKWLDAKVPEAEGKKTTLYRYATVAGRYTKQDVEAATMSKLECLMVHDQITQAGQVPGRPVDREIELLQKDGSTVTKKFIGCSCSEIRQSNQLRKKGQSPPASAAATPAQSQVSSLKKFLAMLAVGIALTALSEFLPFGGWTLVIGSALCLGGIGGLIRHRDIALERLLSALRSGKASGFFNGLVARATHRVQTWASAIRSSIKARSLPASKDETTLEQKKAA